LWQHKKDIAHLSNTGITKNVTRLKESDHLHAIDLSTMKQSKKQNKKTKAGLLIASALRTTGSKKRNFCCLNKTYLRT